MDILDALSRSDRIRHVTTRHEQGAAFMADVHGRLTGQCRRRDGDPRSRRDEPRHRRSPTPTSTGRRWSRSPARPARTSSTRRPTSSSTSSGCSSRSRSGTPGSSGSTRSPRSSARRSGWPSSRSPGRPTSSCPRTSPRCRPSPATRRARSSRRGPTCPSRPTRRSPTPPGSSPAPSGRSSWPATASSGGAPRTALRAFARGLHVPVAVTFMGKGAIDDRSHLSLMAVGLQARDHVLTGFDRADLVVSVGYDLVEYAPSALEPGRHEADRPHRHAAGRGRRRLPAGGRAHRRHRRDAASGCSRRSSRSASAGATRPSATRRRRSSSTPTCALALLRDLEAYEADDGFPIKPQKAIADLRRALEPDDIVVSRRRRPQGLGRPALPGLRAEHRDHLERLRGDGHLAARARSRPSSSTPSGGSSPCAATAAS